MQTIKGFTEISNLIDNSVNTVSELGELSPLSLTYSRDVTRQESVAFPGITLVVFSSKGSLSERLNVTQVQTDIIIKLVSMLIRYYKTAILPVDETDLADYIHSSDPGYTQFNHGPVIQTPKQNLPDWISFKHTGSPDTQFKIWLSDRSFADQFDEFDTVVIPPFEDIDYFFEAPVNVVDRLNSISMTDMVAGIEKAKQGHPFTYLRNLEINYVYSTNPLETKKSNWAILLYGAAGDNKDSIKDSIVDYVLANSKYTRDRWAAILPDLFSRVEFVYLPRWERMAMDNMVTQSGIYSPVIDPRDTIDFTVKRIKFYPEQYIRDNVLVITHPYKCIQIAVISGTDNAGDSRSFLTMYPDYINVQSTSIDFNRMSAKTTNMLTILEEMLVLAESITSLTTIPTKFRRIRRGDDTYLSSIIDDIQHLVLIRNS